MLKTEDNERLTRVGPGNPMGVLLRRYWHPALLSSEIPERDGPPVRVRLLGEDLIAFRDTQDRIGMIDAYCAHRRAPLFYGRNEECGIRCVYHGWKFDVEGNCVDLPSLPADSPVKAKVHIKSYPAIDKAGVIWVYMGPADQEPPLPDYEWMRALPTHRHVAKNYRRAITSKPWKAGWIRHIPRFCITTFWALDATPFETRTLLLRSKFIRPSMATNTCRCES